MFKIKFTTFYLIICVFLLHSTSVYSMELEEKDNSSYACGFNQKPTEDKQIEIKACLKTINEIYQSSLYEQLDEALLKDTSLKLAKLYKDIAEKTTDPETKYKYIYNAIIYYIKYGSSDAYTLMHVLTENYAGYKTPYTHAYSTRFSFGDFAYNSLYVKTLSTTNDAFSRINAKPCYQIRITNVSTKTSSKTARRVSKKLHHT